MKRPDYINMLKEAKKPTKSKQKPEYLLLYTSAESKIMTFIFTYLPKYKASVKCRDYAILELATLYRRLYKMLSLVACSFAFLLFAIFNASYEECRHEAGFQHLLSLLHQGYDSKNNARYFVVG